jgi:hypothetical protein
MLLPDPKRRGEIHFAIAKSLSYGKRMAIIVLLLVAGFGYQVWNLDLLPISACLLFAESLLAVVKGYRNYPEAPGPKREWRSADKEQLKKILDIAEKAKSWDQSAIDITCGSGCGTLLVMIVVVSLVVMSLYGAGHELLAIAIAVDMGVLFLPHWVTGVRRILTNAPLTVKVQNLLHVYSLWEAAKKEGEKMTVQMEVAKGKEGEVPTDAKLILQIPELGDSFYGVQTQVVLNNVQGADYPYVYCVLVAKEAMGMRGKLGSSVMSDKVAFEPTVSGWAKFLGKPSLGITVEWKLQDGMDVMVIRQATTKESGYFTDGPAIDRIFSFAHSQAMKLVKS